MFFFRLTVALLMLVTIACADSEPAASSEAPPESSGQEPAAPTQESASGQSFAFTADDLDAYALGIAKEIELVKAAQERASTAKTANERGEAMQAQWEDRTIPEAARLAGIDADRYRRTREAVHEVFKTLDFQGKIDGPLSIDLSRVDEATRAKLARDPMTDLEPSSAGALHAKMPKLVPLWIEYVNLTAVAG